MNNTATPYEPQHLKRWSMPDSYAGEVWPEYYSTGFGQSRDSDALERSNFEVVQRELAKLPEWPDGDSRNVIRESHWAVGWVEWIAIHQDDAAALKLCDELRGSYEDYPVLDEGHYSELEHEEATQVWHDCYSPKERLAYIREHRGSFDFHDFKDLLGCIRGRYFAGDASSLLS